jgi:hypothetical protein
MYEADIGNSERFRKRPRNVNVNVNLLQKIQRDLSRRRDLYTDLFCVEWNWCGKEALGKAWRALTHRDICERHEDTEEIVRNGGHLM